MKEALCIQASGIIRLKQETVTHSFIQAGFPAILDFELLGIAEAPERRTIRFCNLPEGGFKGSAAVIRPLERFKEFVKKQTGIETTDLKAASEERDRFLEKHPELNEFQREIDRLLNNAGTFENRMAVLGIMMEARLKDLQRQLWKLESLVTRLLE